MVNGTKSPISRRRIFSFVFAPKSRLPKWRWQQHVCSTPTPISRHVRCGLFVRVKICAVIQPDAGEAKKAAAFAMSSGSYVWNAGETPARAGFEKLFQELIDLGRRH